MTVDEILASERLLKRFCKDCRIPINIFKSPYFLDRLLLFDSTYDCLKKWDVFVNELEKYKNEQEYFEEYTRVKEAAMNFIETSEGFCIFNNTSMDKFPINTYGISSNNIYHPSNDGSNFISIDMKQANYTALKMFHGGIFDNEKSWEDFLRKFTDNEHIVNSKYIRQVILGHCNPKRQIHYEKYLMSMVLDKLFNNDRFTCKVVSFENDGIVIDVSNTLDVYWLFKEVKYLCSDFTFPLEVEMFQLRKIKGVDGYYKIPIVSKNVNCKAKGVDANMLPIVLRKFKGDDITYNDLIIVHDGHLARLLELPEIEV